MLHAYYAIIQSLKLPFREISWVTGLSTCKKPLEGRANGDNSAIITDLRAEACFKAEVFADVRLIARRREKTRDSMVRTNFLRV